MTAVPAGVARCPRANWSSPCIPQNWKEIQSGFVLSQLVLGHFVTRQQRAETNFYRVTDAIWTPAFCKLGLSLLRLD